jgi:hypothetical protein
MCVTRTGYLAMGIKGQTMGCTVLFTEDHPDVSIPALEYASFGSVPYIMELSSHRYTKCGEVVKDIFRLL